jgi:pantoate kinase
MFLGLRRAWGPGTPWFPGGETFTETRADLPRNAFAVAPGHVTGIFVPEVEDPDLIAQGSRGAGVVLDVGVSARATLQRASREGEGALRIRERGEAARFPITQEALQSLPGLRDWDVEVDLQHELPVSQGLGMSAAGSLAACLATAELLGLPSRAAVEAAHRAEVRLHGGLGGVVSILEGGVEVRRKAGLPPHGVVERTPMAQGFFLGTLDRPLPSPPLLSDPEFLLRVRRAGERWLSELGPPPIRWEALLSVFEVFTDELGLAPPPLRDAMLSLRQQGCRCAQTMLGNTLLAWAPDEDAEERLIRTLRQARLTLRRVHVGREGARSRPWPGAADAPPSERL